PTRRSSDLAGHILTEHIGQRQRVAGRPGVLRNGAGDYFDGVDDDVEFACELFNFFLGEVDEREFRDPGDLLRVHFRHDPQSICGVGSGSATAACSWSNGTVRSAGPRPKPHSVATPKSVIPARFAASIRA